MLGENGGSSGHQTKVWLPIRSEPNPRSALVFCGKSEVHAFLPSKKSQGNIRGKGFLLGGVGVFTTVIFHVGHNPSLEAVYQKEEKRRGPARCTNHTTAIVLNASTQQRQTFQVQTVWNSTLIHIAVVEFTILVSCVHLDLFLRNDWQCGPLVSQESEILWSSKAANAWRCCWRVLLWSSST